MDRHGLKPHLRPIYAPPERCIDTSGEIWKDSGNGPNEPFQLMKRYAARVFLGLAVVVVALAITVHALQFRPPQFRHDWDQGVTRSAESLRWDTVGGDSGHGRYSALDQINRRNVGRLVAAWVYHTGELERRGPVARRAKFQATPIIAAGNLVLCTPFNRAIALDPQSGHERWVYEPSIDLAMRPANDFNCRGLARWEDPAATPDDPCAQRVFMATNDRRLIALDARLGKTCPGFGHNGEVTVIDAAELTWPGEVQIVAAPAVVGDIVVVGCSVADNQRAAAPSGKVRAYDARTGTLVWTFDPTPGANRRTGAGNVWSSISVDSEAGVVFLPTSSPSPDFYGATRSGDPGLTDAVVAVRASDGHVLWSFQTVHHDLWDYDVPAAPTLLTLRRGAERIPSVAIATKSGMLFVLDRRTGIPLYPVIERPVPASDVRGEVASPTQPFSTLPLLAPQSLQPADAFGVVGWDRYQCRRKIEAARHDGAFTPPSLRGTLFAPTTGGGANWGGVSIDPHRNRLFANTSRAAEIIRLIPRASSGSSADTVPEGAAAQLGTPYAVTRQILLSPLGLPCRAPPWGVLAAIDLDTGARAWESPLGSTSTLAPFGIALPWGTPNLGGSIVTGGGLVFVGAAMDSRLRAFDEETGAELWAGDLPAGGQATPMTYAVAGRQYIVIAAGGHSVLGTARGDSLVAFALPQNNRS